MNRLFHNFEIGNEGSMASLRASPTVPVELKLLVELNSFSDASRFREPANDSLF